MPQNNNCGICLIDIRQMPHFSVNRVTKITFFGFQEQNFWFPNAVIQITGIVRIGALNKVWRKKLECNLQNLRLLMHKKISVLKYDCQKEKISSLNFA